MAKPRNKGGRRAYLKRWSSEYINAGKKSRSVDLRRWMDDATFPGYWATIKATNSHVKSLERGIQLPQSKGVSQPRAEALKKSIAWQSGRVQGVTRFNQLILSQSPLTTVSLCIADTGTQCFLLMQYKRRLRLWTKASIIYDSRIEAAKAYSSGTVVWVEETSSPLPPETISA